MTRLAAEGDLQGIVQECLNLNVFEQILYAKPRTRPGKWNAQTYLGFWDTNRSFNLG